MRWRTNSGTRAGRSIRCTRSIRCGSTTSGSAYRSPGGAWPLFPPAVWLAVAIAVAGGLALRYTRFGRHVYAVGSNDAGFAG